MDILKRIAREWLVITTALVGAAFMVGSGLGWIQYLSGITLDNLWINLGVFIIFAIIVVIRLVKLQSTIDEIKGDIKFTATPVKFALNYAAPNEPPLRKNEVSLYTTIQFEIWTHVDITTSKLVLNLVSFSNLFPTGWELFKPFKMKRLIGITIEGSGDSNYRKTIRRSDKQPYKDTVSFKWKGEADRLIWARHHMPELALELWIPKRTLRIYLDRRILQRQSCEIAPL